MIKQIVRKWIGIDDLSQQINTSIHCVMADIQKLSAEKRQDQRERNVLFNGIGRVLAKIDPNYARSEIDADRQAESDKIGEEIIRKLYSEWEARDKHNV